MSPSYAVKGGARYRYYTSQALLQGRKADAGSVARVPAPEIEAVVLDALRPIAGPEPDCMGPESGSNRIGRLVEAVTIRKGAVEIRLTQEGAIRNGTPTLTVPWCPPARTRSRAVIAPADGSTPLRTMPSDVRRTLLVSIAKARSWMALLASREVADVEAIARREGRSERHVRMLLPLAGLAPDLIEAAVAGRLPEGAGVTGLVPDLPLAWADQRARVAVLPAP
jgi:site-specific DNA recombinase